MVLIWVHLDILTIIRNTFWFLVKVQQWIRQYHVDCREIVFNQSYGADKKFCWSLHYNGENNYIFVIGIEIHEYDAQDSKINASPLCVQPQVFNE